MTFWNFFFSNPRDTNLNAIAIDKSSTDSNLLIKHFEKDGKVLDIYLQTGRNINLYELEQLCDAVGWVRRPINKVKIAIEHSFLTISLFSKEQNKQKLIGFARATSDTAFNATIWDVVIHPDFQGYGLGKILMDQIVKELRYYDISTITLFADPQVVNFYRNIGFITDPDGVKGMFWYPL
uniref:GCN5-like N-acetyltransferase n=1 Tax=Gelidium vagum TaxID=35171 RepID=A0A141SE53_GELVA|nr:GCN5-like N-acetyltransferase [Gelidium vagum]AMK96571.1 GCN5-like N-acetyltransferase [Gelidium vagum]